MSYEQAKSLLTKGVSRPTLFSVRLPNRKVSGDTNDYLDFFCQATAIPEVRANTIAVAGNEYMGIVREQATTVMFGKPFSITVIADPDYKVYNDLRGWFDQIAQNSSQTSGRTQRMRYYNTYTEDMQLIKLEQDSGPGYRQVMNVNFINAYPINIGQVSLETGTTDTYTTFNVDFTYESYTLSNGSNVIVDIANFLSGLT